MVKNRSASNSGQTKKLSDVKIGYSLAINHQPNKGHNQVSSKVSHMVKNRSSGKVDNVQKQVTS